MPCEVCNSRFSSKVCGHGGDAPMCCQKRCNAKCERCEQQGNVSVATQSELAPVLAPRLPCESEQAEDAPREEAPPCPALQADQDAARAAYQALGITQHSAASFAADVLLGNFDNLVQDGSTRALSPGSLGHASRCAACKSPPDSSAFWCAHPTELWSRRANGHPSTIFQLMQQVRDTLVPNKVALLGALTAGPKLIVSRRLEQLEHVAEVARVMEADQWLAPYVDGLLKHTVGLRCEGIPDKLPRLLTAASMASYFASLKKRYDYLEDDEIRGKAAQQVSEDRASQPFSYILFDDDSESTAPYGNLRGDNNLVTQVSSYMDRVGGSSRYINFWMTQQAEDSWTRSSMGIKYFFADQRSVAKDVYYWGTHKAMDENKCKVLQDSLCVSEAGSLAILRESWFVWHAFTMEILDKVEFPNRDAAQRTVKLIRTDGPSEITRAGFVKGTPKVAPPGFRGACESASLTKPVTIFNNTFTYQDVPYHRIVGVYFTTRPGETTQCAFKADSEGEFVFLPEGLTVLFTDPPQPPKVEFSW